MNDFIMQYGLCILLCAIGLFFIVMTYSAHFAGRSGVPMLGGLLIAIGFLTTPIKWLALSGLILDPGYLSIPYFLILDNIRNKKFQAVYSNRNYAEKATDDTKRLRIYIPARDEELIRPYITCHMYELRIPKLLFAVCMDKTGKRFILVDKCFKGGQIEISEFDNDSIILSGIKEKNVEMRVEIEIIGKENR